MTTPAPVRVRVLVAALVGILVGVAATVAVMVSAQDGGQGAPPALEARIVQLEARMTGAATLFTAHDRRLGALESHDHGAGPFETITLTGTGETRIHLLDDLPAGRYRGTLTSSEARAIIRTADGFGSSKSVTVSHTRPLEFSAVEGPRDTFIEGQIGVHDEIHVRVLTRDQRASWTLTIERLGDLPTAP